MKKPTRWLSIVLTVSLVVLLRCGEDYNPYENYSNAQIHMISSRTMLNDGDTVAIFTTETLGVFTTVSEKIERFSIHTDSNIHWTDTCIETPDSRINYRFLVSYSDTGLKSITITTERTNGDVSTQALALHVRSPLYQEDIAAAIGEPCTLSTAPVGDRVYYYWSFGVYRDVEKVIMTPFSNNPDQYIRGIEVGKKRIGYLWVVDTLNRFKSPACAFSYQFTDDTGPKIVNTNKGLRGDTIVTGESNFEFSIHVMDESGDQVDSVELVGGQFDWHSGDGLDYKKYFIDMNAYTSQHPNIVIIKAWDMHANVTVDTFFLYYNAAGPKADRVKLTLYSPPSRNVSTRLDRILVSIGVENKTGDTLILHATVNGQPFLPEKTVPDTAATVVWDITKLAYGINTATITAFKGSTQYAETTLTIERDTSSSDTSNPVIVFVEVDNQKISLDYPLFSTPKRSVDLAVAVFDAGSGVVSVTANGVAFSAYDSTKYLWTRKKYPLVHPYKGIEIKATDAAGNTYLDTILVVSNNPPVVIEPTAAALPNAFLIRTSYSDTIIVRDDDNDTVSLSIKNGPPGMGITSVGLNKWRISYVSADTGSYRLEILFKDPYSKEVVIPWGFRVIQDMSHLVRFVTTIDSFPRFLEADHDTLRVNLIASSGFPPYRFTAFIDGKPLPVMDKSSDGIARAAQLVWPPQAADTGYRQLIVTVIDTAGITDTIKPNPTIQIVPKNMHACSLSAIPNKYLTSKGVLDMSMAVRPDTLLFLISDNDHPLTEHYTVNVMLGNVTIAPTILMLKTFSVIVNPTFDKLHDTLRIAVTDRTGTRDTMTIPVIYYITAPINIPDVFMWNTGDSTTVVLEGEAKVTLWEPFIMAPVELVRNVNVEGVPTYVDGTPLESWPSQPYLHFSREGKNHLINPNYGKWPLKPFNTFFVVRLDTVLKDSCSTVISSSESYGSSTALGVTKDGTFGMFYGGDIEISVGSKCKVDPHKWYIVSFTSTGIIPDKPSMSFSVRANGVTDSNLVIEGASAAPYLMVGATGKHEATDAFNGDIAEIIMFSRILSVEEWTQTARYLESKYRYMLEENNTFTGR